MNYAVDKVDNRDYSVWVILWQSENLPDKVLLQDNEVQDQSIDESTEYGCVFFTGSTISNTMNYLNKEKQRISGKELCSIAENKGLLDRKKWAYISSSPKLLKELWYIEAYARAKSLYDVKLSLSKNKPIQTWSVRINRTKTKENDDIVVSWSSYGHSFTICGYDDEREVLICENSYGIDDFHNWYFYIKYDDFSLLFESKYIMTDKIENIPNNRYWKHLVPHIKNWYTPIYEDYAEKELLNAGEIKTLIDLAQIKKWNT